MLIAVLIIGAGLIAFGGTMGKQVDETGQAIASWTGGAIGAGDSAIESPQEKAERELAEKDPKDWTLDDQKRVAEDISANGSASKFYEKAKSAMDAGTTWSVTLTNGKEMQYRIIGMNHDDLTDGSGKAGLTFMFSNELERIGTDSNVRGPWKSSYIRTELNSESFWMLLPSEMQNKIRSVDKVTNNDKYTSDSVSETSDKLFLLSQIELSGIGSTKYPWRSREGHVYEGLGSRFPSCWTRTMDSYNGVTLGDMGSDGTVSAAWHSSWVSLQPAWCF